MAGVMTKLPESLSACDLVPPMLILLRWDGFSNGSPITLWPTAPQQRAEHRRWAKRFLATRRDSNVRCSDFVAKVVGDPAEQ
jgi:hypothetical protein